MRNSDVEDDDDDDGDGDDVEDGDDGKDGGDYMTLMSNWGIQLMATSRSHASAQLRGRTHRHSFEIARIGTASRSHASAQL